MSKDKKLCATGQMAQLNAAKATKKIVEKEYQTIKSESFLRSSKKWGIF
jgi:hypothetical protein